MNRTPIEWVKNVNGTPGYTCNPMTGCLNCLNGKCGGAFPCYAYLQSHGRCHQQDLKGLPIKSLVNVDSFYPAIHHDRFQQLFDAPRGAGIFVCDRSDWAASYWPQWCQEEILKAAWDRPDIRLYLLTKQPQELPKWSPFPDNVWVGVSACNEAMYLKACMELHNIKATVKFLSCEPLQEQFHEHSTILEWAGINWLIIGAQTKPYKPPEIEWVQGIVKAADQAYIPVFLKNNLLELVNYQSPETAFAFNKEGYLRQEMPKIVGIGQTAENIPPTTPTDRYQTP
jgi:protein gp37